MEVRRVNQAVPHPAVPWMEGAEVSFCSGKRHSHCVVSIAVGCSAGVLGGYVWRRQTKWSKVWSLLYQGFVHDAETRYIPPLLQWLESGFCTWLPVVNHPLCPSLDSIKLGKIRRWAGRPGQWGIFHYRAHLGPVKCRYTASVKNVADASYAAQFPRRVPGHFAHVFGVAESCVDFYPQN